ncbi:MAG: MFS transporter [Thermoleophilia bacterium]|nr:MFS transporter [Thermoleophilia bacterium]
MTKQKLWTRGFALITLLNFLLAMNFLLLLAVLTKFATERMGASTALAGFAAGIFIIGAVFSRPVCGKWIHHMGQTKLLYVGMVLSLGLTLAYFVADSIAILLVIRFFHGMAFGAAHVAAGTIVAGVIPQERYGEGIGYYTLSQILGNALAPFVALLLIHHTDFETVITAAAVAVGIGLAIIPFVSVKDMELTAEQVQETRGFKLRSFIEPGAVPIALVTMVLYLCFTSILSFLALYSEEIGLIDAASVFFLIYATVVFVARPFVGRRFDTKGENSVMYPAIVIFAAGMALFSQARQGYVLLLAAVIIGIGFGAIQATGQTIAVKITPPHRVGLATSTFFLFADIGVGLSPFLCGLAIPSLGYRGTYLAVAAAVAASLLLYYALYGRRVGDRVAASMKMRAP